MRSQNEQTNEIPPSNYRELKLLSEIENDPEATQRQLSKRVGIALGLTNVLIHNLAQKGYLRATKADWKRRLYALTPDGFTHKLRLTLAYIHRIMDHYQAVRQTLRDELANLALNKESRVAVFGTTEIAELVYLGLREIGIEDIDFYEATEPDGRRFLGMPIHGLQSLQVENYDRIVVANLSDSWTDSQKLRAQGVPEEKMFMIFSESTIVVGK
jgi:DNA-binding MarR family transcriptional regulator